MTTGRSRAVALGATESDRMRGWLLSTVPGGAIDASREGGRTAWEAVPGTDGADALCMGM